MALAMANKPSGHFCGYQTLRTEAFRAYDDRDAHRAAMIRMMRVGGFSGYELSVEGRKVEVRQAGQKPR